MAPTAASLTQTVDGKTKSRFLTTGQAVVARQQIAAGREFREHVDPYRETNRGSGASARRGGGTRVGSCRREILDQVIALNERQLRRLVRDH